MQIAGWIVAVALALVVGFAGGVSTGKASERSSVANECWQGGRLSASGQVLNAG